MNYTLNLGFIPMNSIGGNTNYFTTVRLRYATQPSRTTTAGIGGTDHGKDTRPHNVTFFRIADLLNNIQSGMKINSAVLSWYVEVQDFPNLVTHCFQACDTIPSPFNGLIGNAILCYGPVVQVGIPLGEKIPVYYDVTALIDFMVQNRFDSFKVFTSVEGDNRRYMAGGCTLTVDYKPSPDPATYTYETDATSINSNNIYSCSYTKLNITNYDSNAYYNYICNLGGNIQSSGWVKFNSWTFTTKGNPGDMSTYYIQASYVPGGTFVSTSSYLQVYRNTYPTINITNIRNTEINKDALINPATGRRIFHNKNIDITLNTQDNSKHITNPSKVSVYVNNKLLVSENITLNNTVNISDIDMSSFAGKNCTVKVDVSDGDLTSTSVINGYVNAGPKITLTNNALSQIFSNNPLETIQPGDEPLNIDSIVSKDPNTNTTIDDYEVTLLKKIGTVESSESITDFESSQTSLDFVYTTPILQSTEQIHSYKFKLKVTDSLSQSYELITSPIRINRLPNNTTITNIHRRSYAYHDDGTRTDINNGYDKNWVSYADAVMLNWSESTDVDDYDSIVYDIYKIKPSEVENLPITIPNNIRLYEQNQRLSQYNRIMVSTNTLNYEDSNLESYIGNPIDYVIVNKDSKNAGLTVPNATIYVSDIVDYPTYNESPFLKIRYYGTSSNGELVEYNYVGNGTSGYPSQISNIVSFEFDDMAMPHCNADDMRYKLEIYSINAYTLLWDNIYQTRIIEKDDLIINADGTLKYLFNHDIPSSDITKIGFRFYTLDRFDNISDPIQMGPFDIRPQLELPQIKGTINGGFRWQYQQVDDYFRTPTFFAEIYNSTETTCTFKVQLKQLNADGTVSVVEEKYTTETDNIPAGNSINNPSRTVKAWRFDTELQNDVIYHITCTLTDGAQVIETQLNESSKFQISTQCNSYKVANWGVGEIIYHTDINVINDYIEGLFTNYGLKPTVVTIDDAPNSVYLDNERGDVIYANENKKNTTIILKPENEEIAEPLGNNLCPYFQAEGPKFWNVQNPQNIIGINSMLMNDNNDMAYSILIPWYKFRTIEDKLYIMFDIRADSSQYNKTFYYSIECFDRRKEMINQFNFKMVYVVPEYVELQQVPSNKAYRFVEVLDGGTYNIMFENIYYVRIRFYRSRTDGILDDSAMTEFYVENVMISDKALNYNSFETYQHPPYGEVLYSYGSRNLVFENQVRKIRDLANQVREIAENSSDQLTYSNTVPTDTINNTFIQDTIITSQHEIESIDQKILQIPNYF